MYEFYKQADLSQVTIVDNDEKIIEGYLGDDNVDFVGHYIEREPYIAAMQEWLQWKNIRDSHGRPVGTVVDYGQKSWNHIKVKIIDDNVWKLVQGGVYKGFSIGARVLKAEFVPIESVPMDKFANLPAMVMTAIKQFGQILKITALQIVEVSITDRPMNPGAVFTKSMSLYGLQLNDGDYKMNELNQEVTTEVPAEEIKTETPEVVEKEVEVDTFDAKAEIQALRQLVDEKYASLTSLVENQVATMNKTLSDLQAIAETFAQKPETKSDEEVPAVETVENAAKVEPAFDMDKFASAVAETVLAKIESVIPKNVERQNEINDGEEPVEKEAKVDIGSLPVHLQAKHLAAQIAKTLNSN